MIGRLSSDWLSDNSMHSYLESGTKSHSASHSNVIPAKIQRLNTFVIC